MYENFFQYPPPNLPKVFSKNGSVRTSDKYSSSAIYKNSFSFLLFNNKKNGIV